MANPLKINTSSGQPNTTNWSGLKTMSAAEMDYACYKILTNFATEANSTTSYVGDLNTIGLGTSRGAYTDQRFQDAVGTHPSAGSTNTVVTTFYQNTDSASETSLIRPLEWQTGGPKEQTDTTLNNSIIDRCLTKIANTSSAAIGEYYIDSTAPAGGTWTEEKSFTDTLTASDGTHATWKLWRKTSDTAPTTVRPIKWSNGEGQDGINEMTDTEINHLTARLRNRIIATGVGTYAFQA